MTRDTDIAVVGGGVIGLSIAYRLAQSGCVVTVIDTVRAGRASWAAAGMLAPLAESNSLPALSELGVPSLRSYPDFVTELADVSGLPLSLEGPGILRVATDEAETANLCESIDRQSQSGFPIQLLNQAETRALEPALGPNVRMATLSSAEKHITPSALMAALRAACTRLGVDFEYGDPATILEKSGSGWEITTGYNSIRCNDFVAAAGVWTRALLAPLGVDIPVEPLKGQIISVRFPEDHLSFTHTVYAHSTYLVPRGSGEILIGATEEPEAGFDAKNSDTAITDLRARSEKLVPSLTDAQLDSARVGLRPASPDRLPIIGRLPGYKNAFIAAGHGRNGILLTPVTADLCRDLIIKGTPPPASVDPARFPR